MSVEQLSKYPVPDSFYTKVLTLAKQLDEINLQEIVDKINQQISRYLMRASISEPKRKVMVLLQGFLNHPSDANWTKLEGIISSPENILYNEGIFGSQVSKTFEMIKSMKDTIKNSGVSTDAFASKIKAMIEDRRNELRGSFFLLSKTKSEKLNVLKAFEDYINKKISWFEVMKIIENNPGYKKPYADPKIRRILLEIKSTIANTDRAINKAIENLSIISEGYKSSDQDLSNLLSALYSFFKTPHPNLKLIKDQIVVVKSFLKDKEVPEEITMTLEILTNATTHYSKKIQPDSSDDKLTTFI